MQHVALVNVEVGQAISRIALRERHVTMRNLNSADNIGLETKCVVAKQTIYRSAKYPSHIVLSVISRP